MLVGVVLIAAIPFATSRADAPAQKAEPQDAHRGAVLFQHYCAACHANDPPPFTGLPLTRHSVEGREAEIRFRIANGGAAMPGFRYMLKEGEIEQIIGFLKTQDEPVGNLGVSRANP